jgi:hypothetical protein
MVSENKGNPFVDLFFFVLQEVISVNFTGFWKPTLYNFVIISKCRKPNCPSLILPPRWRRATWQLIYTLSPPTNINTDNACNFLLRRMVSENKGNPFVDLFFFVLQEVISVNAVVSRPSSTVG